MKKPTIVFLDAATVDLGDLDMTPISSQGTYRAFSKSTDAQILTRARNATIIVTNKGQLRGALLRKLPHLRLICDTATGVDNLDLEAARDQGVAVTNVAGYSTTTVAEHTLAFLLACSHRLLEHNDACHNGLWSHSPHFAHLDFPFSDLAGKTLGVIGYGTIGRRVARLARALDMKVIVAKIPGRSYGSRPARVPLNTLLKKSDFVSLHCPLSDATRNLIDKKALHLMKPTAFLLNLARGPVVDEAALAEALKKNRLAGYATDVTAVEPPPKNHPLLQESHKVLMTPHIAWASRESRQRVVDEVGENIRAFLRGQKRNRVV